MTSTLRLFWWRNRRDGLCFGYVRAVFRIGFLFLHSGLELPRPDSKTNKCVREYLQTHPAAVLSGYEIDRIIDIEKPHDDTVAGRPFNGNTIGFAMHTLVVELCARV